MGKGGSLPSTVSPHQEASSASKDPPQQPRYQKHEGLVKNHYAVSSQGPKESPSPTAAAVSDGFTDIWPKAQDRPSGTGVLPVGGRERMHSEAWSGRQGRAQWAAGRQLGGSSCAAGCLGCDHSSYHRYFLSLLCMLKLMQDPVTQNYQEQRSRI